MIRTSRSSLREKPVEQTKTIILQPESPPRQARKSFEKVTNDGHKQHVTVVTGEPRVVSSNVVSKGEPVAYNTQRDNMLVNRPPVEISDVVSYDVGNTGGLKESNILMNHRPISPINQLPRRSEGTRVSRSKTPDARTVVVKNDNMKKSEIIRTSNPGRMSYQGFGDEHILHTPEPLQRKTVSFAEKDNIRGLTVSSQRGKAEIVATKKGDDVVVSTTKGNPVVSTVGLKN